MRQFFPWVLVVAACAHDVEKQPDAPAAPGTTHVVKPGETVWDIARQAGLSVEEIVEVNGLQNPDEIAAGQILFLPAGAAPVVDAPAPAERLEPEIAPP